MSRDRTRCGSALRNRRGATLVEALVAVGLFGVAAASMGDLFVRQVRIQGANTTATTAIGMAQADLEDLRALTYDEIASHVATQTVGGIRYDLDTEVIPDSPEAGMKTLRATVIWAEPDGVKSYDLHAIYTDVAR